MNWKWPATKTNGKNPWYVILRRSIMWPMLMLGVFIVAGAAWAGRGRRECDEFLREIGW